MASFERCVVLVVDDEPAILHIVSYALARHGYDVITANDGPAALRLCERREGPIHLAVLDVMMPGMNGPELFRCLQEARPEIAVLFMSGYSVEQIAEVGSVEAASFLPKPFRPMALVERVNQILGNTEVCVLLEDETGVVVA